MSKQGPLVHNSKKEKKIFFFVCSTMCADFLGDMLMAGVGIALQEMMKPYLPEGVPFLSNMVYTRNYKQYMFATAEQRDPSKGVLFRCQGGYLQVDSNNAGVDIHLGHLSVYVPSQEPVEQQQPQPPDQAEQDHVPASLSKLALSFKASLQMIHQVLGMFRMFGIARLTIQSALINFYQSDDQGIVYCASLRDFSFCGLHQKSSSCCINVVHCQTTPEPFALFDANWTEDAQPLFRAQIDNLLLKDIIVFFSSKERAMQGCSVTFDNLVVALSNDKPLVTLGHGTISFILSNTEKNTYDVALTLVDLSITYKTICFQSSSTPIQCSIINQEHIIVSTIVGDVRIIQGAASTHTIDSVGDYLKQLQEILVYIDPYMIKQTWLSNVKVANIEWNTPVGPIAVDSITIQNKKNATWYLLARHVVLPVQKLHIHTVLIDKTKIHTTMMF